MNIENYEMTWAVPEYIVQCNFHYRETIGFYHYETKAYLTESAVAIFHIKFKNPINETSEPACRADFETDEIP